MTETMNKLIACVEELTKTVAALQESQQQIEKKQEETNEINTNILVALTEIKDALLSEESNEENEVKPSEQIQNHVNAAFDALATHASETINENNLNQYTPPVEDDFEEMAKKFKPDIGERLNSVKMSSIDDYNLNKPSQPIETVQMNLDSVFGDRTQQQSQVVHTIPNNQSTCKLALSADKNSVMIINSATNREIRVYRNSIGWNTLMNKMKSENRKIKSLTDDEITGFLMYLKTFADKGVNATTSDGKFIKGNNNAYFETPTGMGYDTNFINGSYENPYSITPVF